MEEQLTIQQRLDLLTMQLEAVQSVSNRKERDERLREWLEDSKTLVGRCGSDQSNGGSDMVEDTSPKLPGVAPSRSGPKPIRQRDPKQYHRMLELLWTGYPDAEVARRLREEFGGDRAVTDSVVSRYHRALITDGRLPERGGKRIRSLRRKKNRPCNIAGDADVRKRMLELLDSGCSDSETMRRLRDEFGRGRGPAQNGVSRWHRKWIADGTLPPRIRKTANERSKGSRGRTKTEPILMAAAVADIPSESSTARCILFDEVEDTKTSHAERSCAGSDDQPTETSPEHRPAPEPHIGPTYVKCRIPGRDGISPYECETLQKRLLSRIKKDPNVWERLSHCRKCPHEIGGPAKRDGQQKQSESSAS